MFSSFSSFSLRFALPRFLVANPCPAVDIKSTEIHDVETKIDRRSRSLKHLLKLNHVNHSLIYHHLQFHNHTPHILGSAYILGAEPEHLNLIYEEEAKVLENWQDSPGEVSKYDWRDYLGDSRYQRAYVDFFEDELVMNGYDWRKVLDEYLFHGKEPLINCLVAGLGHPLIHLGYAFELSSREVAMEALCLAATQYSFLHKYLDDPSYTKLVPKATSSPFEIIERVFNDKRLDGLFDHQGASNIGPLFDEHEDVVLEHWNTWRITNPKKQFEDSQHAAVALLAATQHQEDRKYDFFLVHLLTSSHAVRIILPMIPARFHVPLVRQWWLLTLAVYIAQLRPVVAVKSVLDYNTRGKDWDWVAKRAIQGEYAADAHFVKALRAMKEAARTWGDKSTFYLKAAVKFGEEFSGWGGFGS